MSNQWIDNRYEIKQELMRSDDGIWYLATDTALKREIMILVTESSEYEALLQTQREMMDASHVSNVEYLQILNAGRYDDYSFIIFQAYSGMPLYQYVEKHAVSLKSVLQWVYRAAQLLQEGQRLGMPEFSVSFDNLWITDQHEILVMNYWKEARSSRTGTNGLTQLLYQCCTLHALAPRQLDIYVNRMQSALKQEQPALRQSVITLVNRTFEHDPSLMSFMSMLKEMMDQPSVPLVEQRVEERIEPSAPIVTEASMDTMMFTSDTAQQLRAKLESERASAEASRPASNAKGTDLEELMSAPNPSGRSRSPREEFQEQPPASKRSLKMKIIAITAGCVVFFGLIGGAILWANSLSDSKSTDTGADIVQPNDELTGSEDSTDDQNAANMDQNEPSVPSTDSTSEEDHENDSDQSTSNNQSEPDKELVTVPSDNNSNNTNTNEGQTDQDPDQQGNTTNPDATGPTTPEGELNPNAPSDGTATVVPGTMPNLIGLTQEEAEKQALAAGLKYSFKKENAEGVEAGKVFKQEPEAGTKVKKGDKITFYVARGK